ncbi:MAG: hypothetical protein IJO63_02435 [Bacilli bacterium]|nr:hypothetical protein [Bacilli bacterium]
MNEQNRKTLLSIISTLILICTLISGSYAFYVIAVSEKVDIATEVKIPACASADLGSATQISLTGDTAAPISDLKALSSTTYRYAFKVTNNCNVTSKLVISLAPSTSSTLPANALKYAIVEQGGSLPTAGSYLNSGNSEKLLTSQIVSEVKANTNITVKYGYELLNTTISAGTSKNYYLYLWVDYYEGDRTQTGANNNITLNKTFSGQLIVSDYSEWDGGDLLGDTVVAYASSSDYTSSQDSSLYRVINQNGYRYEGKDPDNYVMFNNELWRIIGAFDGSSIGLTSGKYYTKLMRVSSTDATTSTVYSVDFANSNLKNYLNGTYLNSINSASQSMIATAKWYLGAASSSYGSYTAADFYNTERSSTPGYGVSTLTMNAKVSVMYISDYGYAAYGPTCNNTSVYVHNYNLECYKHNWMYKYTYQYSMVPYAPSAYIMRVQNTGNLFPEQWPTDPTSRSWRPVVYLNNDVKIIGGKGTQANPYVISQ